MYTQTEKIRDWMALPGSVMTFSEQDSDVDL